MEILNNNSKNLNPTAGDAFGEGWNIMWKSFLALFVVSILASILSGPIAMFQLKEGGSVGSFHWFLIPVAMFALIYGVFIAGPISYSTNWVFLLAVRGEKFEIRDMFAVFQKNYWNAVAANIVVGIIILFGIFMLVIPGIIFAIRLSFVSYLIIDREMELTEALNKSWSMTKGYGWQIFFMGIISFFVAILGLIAFFVGIIVSIVWIQTAFATMYQAVVEKDGHFMDPTIEE